MPAVLAIDIGGTKIDAGIVDADGRILARRRIETGGAADGEDLFDRLVGLIEAVAAGGGRRGLVACGVGTGGPMTRSGATVSPLNIPAWRRFPLLERLSEAVPAPVHIDNDAKALALGEAWKGAAQGERNFMAMVVSTGIGGGIVLDGRLLEGAEGNAGHIGHVVVRPGGSELPGHVPGVLEASELPGHVPGVLEAEASGPAIARRTGRPAAEAGPDEIDRAGTLVGRAVGSVANLLDLRLALVAGSVALGFGKPFFAAAQREVDRVARLDHSLGARVRPAGLGADGPLIGAAAVGWRGSGRHVGVR